MKRSIMLALAVMSALLLTPFSTLAAPKEGKFFQSVKVKGALSDGGTFTGKVTVTEFGYSETSGLWVSGFVQGTATKADGTVVENVKQSFSQVPATLNESGGGFKAAGVQAQAQCQILFLDIGPIFLDLLGLQLDLSQITLDLTAVSGAGNLLGNLLCAVAGLLDPNGFLTDLIGGLTALLDLLNQINNII